MIDFIKFALETINYLEQSTSSAGAGISELDPTFIPPSGQVAPADTFNNNAAGNCVGTATPLALPAGRFFDITKEKEVC